MSEDGIVQVLREKGPLTGAELQQEAGIEPLQLWRSCLNDSRVDIRIVGRRYLRLDRNVEGYARLSPSIRREFLTYTLLDNDESSTRLDTRAVHLTEEILRISDAKRRLASQTISNIVESLPNKDEINGKVCFVLAGDITYQMAHRVSRPERSTGKLVRGSDLDIIVVTENDLDPRVRESLDDAIYQKKHWLLVSPSYREELDYLIKDLATVELQLEFDTFEHMVACKILDEGEFLYGSSHLMETIEELLVQKGVRQRVADLEGAAIAHRERAVETLRQDDGEHVGNQYLNLFYTSDESDEIY